MHAASIYVSLAYRCWDDQQSYRQNQRLYGQQASPSGVGGNWRVELRGGDLPSGLKYIKQKLDHRCLFADWPEFRTRPSTLENVATLLGQQLFARDPALEELTVYENDHSSICVGRAEVELRLRVLNLTLSFRQLPDENGLMTSRALVTQAVMELYQDRLAGGPDWARTILTALRARLPGLHSLRVDAKPGEYIVVA